MAVKRPNEPIFMTAEQAATRRGYAGRSELALRNSLEAFCRNRWPEARICHEMMMGERKVRADVVAIGPAHIAAFEVKGEYDDTVRLLHQVGMYQLCVPEVWMVVPMGRHAEDARILRHLLPSVGLLVGAGKSQAYHYQFDGKDFDLVVEAEAEPRPAHAEMMLEMLWAAELRGCCGRLNIQMGKNPTRPQMIKRLLELSVETLQREVCAELRARDAMWRADAPIALNDAAFLHEER